jgi:hypothetical protein
MNALKTAYHIGNGPTQMYAVDADSAVRNHPKEWSFVPWEVDESNAWRREHDLPVAEVTDETRAALSEDAQRRQEAYQLVKEYDEKKLAERMYEEKVAAARALLATPRPQVEAPSTVPPAAPASSDPSEPVEIPSDWHDLSVAKRRSIAQKLGAPPTVKGDEADAMIDAEVQRRAEQRKAELEAAKQKTP